MLFRSGYVTGVDVRNTFDCNYPKATLVRPEITLKGLEYLNENAIMKKVANFFKGIKESVPGL